MDHDKSRKEWKKLVEENRKLREAFEVLQPAEAASIIRRIRDAGAAATGSHDPVHGDAWAGKRLASDGHASILPTVPGSQRQHGGGAAIEYVNGGVVRAVLGSNIADGSASAWIRV